MFASVSVVLPNILDFISPPYPDYVPGRFPAVVPTVFSTIYLCTRPIIDFFTGRFPHYVADRCHKHLQGRFPALTRNKGNSSRPVNQMACRLPVSLPSRRKETELLYYPIDLETKKEFRLRRKKLHASRTDRFLRYRAHHKFHSLCLFLRSTRFADNMTLKQTLWF